MIESGPSGCFLSALILLVASVLLVASSFQSHWINYTDPDTDEDTNQGLWRKCYLQNHDRPNRKHKIRVCEFSNDLEEARDLMSWAYMAIIVAGICYLTLLTCRSMLILEGAVLLQFIAGCIELKVVHLVSIFATTQEDHTTGGNYKLAVLSALLFYINSAMVFSYGKSVLTRTPTLTNCLKFADGKHKSTNYFVFRSGELENVKLL